MSTTDESQPGRHRKVRFHGRVQFKTIRHVADFTEEEIGDGWYRKNDFIRMSDEVSEIAKLLAQGQEYYDGEELCIRGLEHLVEEDVADYRAEKMIASIDAVLDEQDEQAEEEINDPDMIAEIYAEIVSPLLREAYLVGLRDAKEGAAAAAQIPDLDMPAASESQQPAHITENEIEGERPPPLPEVEMEEKEAAVIPQEITTEKTTAEEDEDEYVGLAGDSGHNDAEGQMNLNTSLNSIGMEILPEKKEPAPTMKTSAETRAQKVKEKIARSPDKSKDDTPRKNLRRKTVDRKGGSELSPFVFRRDGTIKFRNFDLEHRKHEQSKMRKECIKSSIFKFLEDDQDDDDFAEFLSKSPANKKKESSTVTRYKAGPPKRMGQRTKKS